MELQEIFNHPHEPIVNGRHRLVLLWAAKAGGTFAVRWFFHHMGLLEEALNYHHFVHRYRLQVLRTSSSYTAELERFCEHPADYTVIKVVRSPFARAVSGYVHSVVNTYEDAGISAFLGRPVSAGHSYSFREYLAYLGPIDLTRCNPHHRLQTHVSELKGLISPDHVIHLEDSMSLIPALEERLGLAPSNLIAFRESVHHTGTTSKYPARFCGDECFALTKKVRQVPPYDLFLDSDIVRRISSLYVEDIHRYGYEIPSIDGPGPGLGRRVGQVTRRDRTAGCRDPDPGPADASGS